MLCNRIRTPVYGHRLQYLEFSHSSHRESNTSSIHLWNMAGAIVHTYYSIHFAHTPSEQAMVNLTLWPTFWPAGLEYMLWPFLRNLVWLHMNVVLRDAILMSWVDVARWRHWSSHCGCRQILNGWTRWCWTAGQVDVAKAKPLSHTAPHCCGST